MAELVKVRFRLEPDADAWPPVGSEGLWAESLGDGEFRIQNTPWFVCGVANGDIVRAAADCDGVLWARDHVRWSGWGTVRVIPFRDGPLAGDLGAVLDVFRPYNVSGEGLAQYGIVALEIPPDSDFAAIKSRLIDGERLGSWSYDEGCVDDRWLDA